MSLMSRRAILQALTVNALATRLASAQTQVVSKAKPLARDAATHDWPAFLGPTHNAISTETKLSRKLPPPLVWALTKGTGYASPAIAGQRLVFLHRLGNEEIVECLHAETGATNWQFRYPTSFEDRYGYNNGPRASPVIEAGAVYTVGAQAQLHCLDLGTGKLIWKRDLEQEYRLRQDFFGAASTPLIEGQLLVVNVGAPGGPCVVGLDQTTGREVWRAGTDWGPSYASPIPAVIHGKRRVLVFAGGESDPPSGGLLSIDPSNGRVDFAFPWRSRTYESVNASCPVVFDNKVFVSASYRTGGALVEIRPTSRPGGYGRRRSSGCTSTRRSTRTATSTGLTDGTNPMRRSRASMRRPARSSGAQRPSGRSRSRPAARASNNRSEPIEDRCWL